jgi:hypothetical protein
MGYGTLVFGTGSGYSPWEDLATFGYKVFK